VCVALVVRRAPVVGVVFNPVTEELYSAVRGRGAFCNDRPIHPSYVSEMTAACVATEFGAARDPRVVADKIRVMHAVVLAPVTPAPRAPRPAPRAPRPAPRAPRPAPRAPRRGLGASF